MSFQKLKKNPILRLLFRPYILIKRYFIRLEYERYYQRYDQMMRLVRSDSLEIELKDFLGVFKVGKESLLAKYILKEGAYEPDLAALVKQYLDPKKDVIDIGANVGFFTVLFGKSVNPEQRVLAAEPTPGALKRLKSNLEQNNVSNVILHEGLVGNSNDSVPFNVVEGKEEYSSMKPIAHDHALAFETKEMQLPCRRLDELVAEHQIHPGFMKVDVEGAEWEVFQGAAGIIDRFRPIVLTELDDRLLKGFGASTREVCAFFERSGYRVMDVDGFGKVREGITTSVLAVPDPVSK